MRRILYSYISIIISFITLSSCSQQRIVTLQEYDGALRNPMKGWREYFDPGVDQKRPEYPYPYGSMIKEYMQWNNLEDTITDGVDKIVAYSNHRWAGDEDINMKVIPRVFLVWVEPWHGGKPQDPKNKDDVNGWHWPSDMTPEYDSPYRQKPGLPYAYLPEEDSLVPIKGGYFDSTFAFRVENLVKKLGEAWDNDPRVAYVEMGIIGEWGEQHDPDITTFWPPHEEPKHFANRTWVPGIEKVLGDAFTKAFKNKKVMVRYAYDFKDYNFGIFWDSWAIQNEIDRGYHAMLSLGDRWKIEPIGGEITWNWGDLSRFKNLEECVNDSIIRGRIIEQIRNLHCNHLGGVTWSDFTHKEFFHNAELIQKALGYRYVISECSFPKRIESGKPFKVSFEVKNEGSSPFYYEWPVQLALLDKDTHEVVWKDTFKGVDIRKWMPGEKWDTLQGCYSVSPSNNTVTGNFKINDIDAGEYVLALSVLDPAGMLPSLRFANINYFNGGYTPICNVGVNEDCIQYQIPDNLFDDPSKDTTLHYLLSKPISVIFDTDMGNDIDDALAMQMLLNYERKGIVDIKGIGISKDNPKAIDFVDGFCRYNKRNHIPLGYIYQGDCPDDNTYLLPTLAAEYEGHKLIDPQRSIRDSLLPAYKMMRKVLSSQPDSSVTIIVTGPLTNMARLLESKPDEYSSLDGISLVSRKVVLVSDMGGVYNDTFPEWNIKTNIEASQIFFSKCPVRVIASGWEIGNALPFPHGVITDSLGNPSSNPLCVAYMKYQPMPYDRPTWDLTAVLQAVEPMNGYFDLSPAGTISVDGNGRTSFMKDRNGKHHYLIIKDGIQGQRTLNALVNRVIK